MGYLDSWQYQALNRSWRQITRPNNLKRRLVCLVRIKNHRCPTKYAHLRFARFRVHTAPKQSLRPSTVLATWLIRQFLTNFKQKFRQSMSAHKPFPFTGMPWMISFDQMHHSQVSEYDATSQLDDQ
jgi:hypothetical protein